MFWLHWSCWSLSLLYQLKCSQKKHRIKLFTFDILNVWVIFKCVEDRENWIWIHIIQKTLMLFRNVKFGNNVIEKSLKISHNSVSLEILLPFSIRLLFSPFKGLFVKRGIIVSQKVLLSITFFYVQIAVARFFCGPQQSFTKISLMFEVLLIIFSSVLQKLIS